MIIVAGHITVDPAGRESYLAGCETIVEQGRAAAGCLDFALSADIVDPARINVYERWDNWDNLQAFRGNGPEDNQSQHILTADVAEFETA
ncbi:MAG TPA: antibiotic biosynthesis monooxygenase [Dietzia timorensis]|uniref:Antibiotic biosynthesis monooxygenase n=1 Tax=Dietzia timorensis TaxID=499555 RepID=A0A921F4Z5_9ACTN|nr:antibiotic biosynthesis monooxygenase [Dietzia timorensis]HJE91722.1 antibiotic biosynthesis monooxygenase [Dietzia timorensis]